MGNSAEERLAQLGMTGDEIELWRAMEGVAERLGQLPVEHDTARHEMDHAIARLQDLLLARPGMRAQGWGADPPVDPSPEENRRRLAEFGMTDAELDLWFATTGVAGGLYHLLSGAQGTPEWHEAAHRVHLVQDFLLARPARRAIG
jgi:hypothetical protein